MWAEHTPLVMRSLLVINSSGRVTRSITRQLTTRFSEGWIARNPGSEIILRDVGLNPPPAVDEEWIAAAFASPDSCTPAMADALAVSNAFIDEIIGADAIVVGAPMYNFGMPAQLKAYIDQIVRVGRTFAFGPDESNPYEPLLEAKPLLLITATGTGGYEPGGPSAHMNFLEPHLEAVFGFLGLTNISLVRVGFEEHQDEHFKKSIAGAEAAVDAMLDKFSQVTHPRVLEMSQKER